MNPKLILGTLLVLSLLLVPSYVLSCDYDLDCAIGSRCLKDSYSWEGVCVGGMWPGNRYDSSPPRPASRRNTQGRTCSFDSDCSYNSVCFKVDRFAIYGTCMER